MRRRRKKNYKTIMVGWRDLPHNLHTIYQFGGSIRQDGEEISFKEDSFIVHTPEKKYYALSKYEGDGGKTLFLDKLAADINLYLARICGPF